MFTERFEGRRAAEDARAARRARCAKDARYTRAAPLMPRQSGIDARATKPHERDRYFAASPPRRARHDVVFCVYEVAQRAAAASVPGFAAA